MPTLNWIGKDAVVNHDKDVPFKLLRKTKSASVGKDSQNLIIHGDNLEALKALMPYYLGKIKCIYIDPPYNTGNEKWVYNDNVSSPKIKKWLGKVVGSQSEDLCRHDKWLCMMYPRLKLLKELLSEDGVIFISINDSEVHHLKILMSDIFHEGNFVAQLIWENKEGGGSSDSNHFRIKHEYVIAYAKNKKLLKIKGVAITNRERYTLSDKHKKERGNYYLQKLNQASIQYSTSLDYPINTPDGTVVYPKQGHKRACWRWSKEKLKWGIDNDFVVIKKDRNDNWQVYTKQYLNVDNKGNYITRTNRPMGVISRFSSTMASKNLEEIFGRKMFDYSKPYLFIRYLISLVTNSKSIILDSYAGSGTLAHAVLDLNKADEGNRKFILVELEDNVAKDVTAERVKRAIKKYEYKAGFEFCELAKPLFNEKGVIEESCTYKQLATYIYFTETQTNIDSGRISNPYIGEYNETEYYLIYREKNKNVLNKTALKKLKKTKSKKVIYADRCMLDDDFLEERNIEFKQIPYGVKIY